MTVYDGDKPCPWLVTVQYRFQTREEADRHIRHIRSTDEFVETVDARYEPHDDGPYKEESDDE